MLGIDLWDSDAHAATLYRSIGRHPEEPASAAELIEAYLGSDAIRTDARRMVGRRSSLVRQGDRWVVYLHPAIAFPRTVAWLLAHELAEWWLRDHRGEPAMERAVDQLAAAILMPRPAFLDAYDAVGGDVPALAAAFHATESAVHLRIGETRGTSLALISPALVRLRGAAWGWPAEREIRRLARTDRLPPELRRVRVADDPRRVVLVAAA